MAVCRKNYRRHLRDTQRSNQGRFMNRLLIIAILIISATPLFAQGQLPDIAKLKADAQKVASIIKGDKAKTQTYCQVLDLSDELDQINQHQDPKKAEDLAQKIDDLQKNLTPNISRCSKRLRTWIQTRKTVRRLCRCSLRSTTPVRVNRESLNRITPAAGSGGGGRTRGGHCCCRGP